MHGPRLEALKNETSNASIFILASGWVKRHWIIVICFRLLVLQRLNKDMYLQKLHA